jgi:lipoprotein-anchoring transpeptidase ErfK/SrfK
MIRSAAFVAVLLAALALAFAGSLVRTRWFEAPAATTGGATQAQAIPAELVTPTTSLAPIAPPPPPTPPTPPQALENGVLIVISKHSQRMFVFKNGRLWASSPVSTGRPGNDTPAGIFPILQKQVQHRSTLYAGASMPYMQRLTWDGVALHAGRLPGFRASHGCIRLPTAFARKLYAITSFRSTAVVIVDERLATAEKARARGGAGVTSELLNASALPPLGQTAPALADTTDTIQLTATSTAANAALLWQQLVRRRPELAALHQQIVPAIVQQREVYRLRASGADAHAICEKIASAGIACLKVAPDRPC